MPWSPEKRAQAAERMRARNADPAFKAASAERMRARHADPEFKAKLTALHADPAFKAASAERKRALNADRHHWSCPRGYEALYRKVRAILGAAAAKAEITALARGEAARATTEAFTAGAAT